MLKDDEGLARIFTEDATLIDAGERKEMHGREVEARPAWLERAARLYSELVSRKHYGSYYIS